MDSGAKTESYIKKKKELFKKLDAFYNKKEKYKDGNIEELSGKDKFIIWLDNLKIYNITNNKIPGLLNNNLINVNTDSDIGTYNLILIWISENLDKFQDYDFTDIPDSSFTKIDDIIKKKSMSSLSVAASSEKKKTFVDIDDINRWILNPEKNPIDDTDMPARSAKYESFYIKAFKILSEQYKKNDKEILNILPKKHLYFKEYDFLYYFYTMKNHKTQRKCELTDEQICVIKLLLENSDHIIHKDKSILQLEIEYLKNIVAKDRQSGIPFYGDSNYTKIQKIFTGVEKQIMHNLVNPDFIKRPNIEWLTTWRIGDYFNNYINFIENKSLSNGKNILEYIYELNNVDEHKEWTKDILLLYKKYNKFYNDIKKLVELDESVVDNKENIKKFTTIEDPIDKYFEKYEDKLKSLKQKKYSNLIDFNTYELKEITNYLNDKEQKSFIEEFNNKEKEYSKLNKEYLKELDEYYKIKDVEKKPEIKVPSPPKKFTIELPNNKILRDGKSIYTYINSMKPVYIDDKTINSFKKIYSNLKDDITAYKNIKDKSYLELIKQETGKSPSKEIKDYMRTELIFSMRKIDIKNNILHDGTGVKDKCNQKIDILTSEEFDDENYPLAKLQLMVRLKFKTNDTYITECIYAPNLYNYYIYCINNKKPFISPTRQPYTERHKKDLMKIMNIIDPELKEPYYIKPINDKLLKINYYEKFTNETSVGRMRFFEILITRKFGNINYLVTKICTIPADIEADTGEFQTNSADITSHTMLFNIINFFNQGRLLSNYMPPYSIQDENNNTQYIDIGIHFNNFKNIEDWCKDRYTGNKSKQDIINMFIRYAEEINNFKL